MNMVYKHKKREFFYNAKRAEIAYYHHLAGDSYGQIAKRMKIHKNQAVRWVQYYKRDFIDCE